MKRKKHIVVLVAILIAMGICATPAYDSLAASVGAFQRCLSELQASNSSLNPIERVVFSLALANTKAPQMEPPVAAPRRRS
ncbi:MAG: hypothetical protein ABSC23_00845 [Bryobacteraceae bacterium]|jgi:hypothetical protein